uniref:CDK5RAP3-like protein n=1 Tax=Acrobeloides nanus TaxID=290746 RepID=A0A914CPB4_9BILA
MPENETILKLLQGSYINYFHCKEIVDILKDTEKDSKNIFGYYSSQRMKDWQEVVNLYQKDNVYLAEAAQLLQRLIQYDIPAMKKQIDKADRAITDSVRKEQEYSKSAIDSRKQYEKELAKMGLKGENLRKELMDLAAGLPTFLTSVSKDIVHLKGAVDYYENFRQFVRNGVRDEPNKFLPLLRLLQNRGDDVTVYEWKKGVAPVQVERPKLEYTEKENKVKSDEIDFGDDNGIDFGEENEIDFGDGIEIEIVGDEQGVVDDGIARGEEALSLLEYPESFQIIVGELEELLVFLKQREVDETSSGAADIYISGIDVRPPEISKVKVNDLKSWTQKLNFLVESLRDPQKVHLFKIRSAPHYVEELLNVLEQKKALEPKYKRMEKLMVEKRKEALEQTKKSQEYLDILIESLKTLQKQIEGEISKKYNNREVNIMGEINTILP